MDQLNQLRTTDLPRLQEIILQERDAASDDKPGTLICPQMSCQILAKPMSWPKFVQHVNGQGYAVLGLSSN